MRISGQKLNPSIKKQLLITFAQTLADIKSPREAENFLNDFFNESELETFTKRLGICYWLTKQRSYENIKNNLKVSSATIASTQTMLDKQGIRMAIKKIEAEEWANLWAEKIQKFIKR